MSKANETQRGSSASYFCSSAKAIDLECQRKNLLVEVFRSSANFILNRCFFFNRVVELSKANEKQRGNATLCVSHNAKTVFGLACIEKIRLVVEVFRLLEKFHLKRLFSIGS